MSDLHLVLGNKAYSSWSLRPWLAMKANGLEFRETVIPLYEEGSKEIILSHSSAGKVPVLHHGQNVVWESLAILDYLADTFPSLSWWPDDPAARALARSVSAEMHAGFSSLRASMPMNLRRDMSGRAFDEAVNSDIARVAAIWGECRKTYGRSGPYLFGAFSNADAMYAPIVTRFKTYGVVLDDLCQAYSNSILNHPAMREWYASAIEEPWIIDKFE